MAARCVFATSIPVSTSSKACAPPAYLHQAFEVRGNEGQLAGGHHPGEYGLLRFIQDTAILCSLPALCTGRDRDRDPVSATGVGLQRDSQEAFDHRVDLLGHL